MTVTTTTRLVIMALVAAALVYAGWHARAVVAQRDMLAYVAAQAQQAQDQRDLAVHVDATNAGNTKASTARVDAAQAEQQVEVRYVTKQVIQYRDRPDAGKCVLPAEWVRIYNASGAGVSVPGPGAARSSAYGSATGVPATP